MTDTRARGSWVAAGVVSLAALALYWRTACPWVLGGDVGEFATLAARGGVAHPPGYPLFTLFLRALAWLPAASPAQAAARATGIAGALAVGAAYAACRSFRASPAAAAVASVAFAFSSTEWLLATQAEVFVPNAALALAIVAAAGPDARVRSGARLAALSLLLGAGLSNHHTILALAPVVVAGGLRAVKQEGARPKHALLAAAALALGLSPYAYTVWASHHAEGRWVWGGPMGAVDLLHHFMRSEYWHAADARPRLFTREHLAALASQVMQDFQWVGLGLAVFGAAYTLSRERELRPGGFAIVLAIILAGPGFLFLATRSGGMGASMTAPLGVYRLIIERFYLLPEALLVVPIAWGADRILGRLAERSAWAVAAVASLALGAVDVATGAARIREHEDATLEHYLVDSLASAPEGAVVLGSGDHRFFGFLYEELARGARPDVTYADVALRNAPWYEARLAGEGLPGFAADPIGAALSTGRPVLVADDFDHEALARHPHYAVGTLVRVLPDGAEMPAPDAIEAMNIELFGRFTRTGPRPRDPWGWAGEADEAYARPWLALAVLYDVAGDTRRAHLEMERAARRSP